MTHTPRLLSGDVAFVNGLLRFQWVYLGVKYSELEVLCWLLLDQQNNSLSRSAACLCEMHGIALETHIQPLLLREENFSVLNICLCFAFLKSRF